MHTGIQFPSGSVDNWELEIIYLRLTFTALIFKVLCGDFLHIILFLGDSLYREENRDKVSCVIFIELMVGYGWEMEKGGLPIGKIKAEWGLQGCQGQVSISWFGWRLALPSVSFDCSSGWCFDGEMHNHCGDSSYKVANERHKSF